MDPFNTRPPDEASKDIQETPKTHETEKELRFDPDVTVRTLPEGTKEFNRQNSFQRVRSRTKDLTIADRTRSQSAPAKIPWVLPSDPRRSQQLRNQLQEAHEQREENEMQQQQQTNHLTENEREEKTQKEKDEEALAVQKWTMGEDPP